VHLVTCGHFQSRDKDGSHTNESAISENLMLHANSMALSVTEGEFWSIEVNINCKLCAPVTLTLTARLSYTNLTRIPWRYTGSANLSFLCQGTSTLH